jgi:hypothetical protein
MADLKNPNSWPRALCQYFAGLLNGEDRLPLIAPWGQERVAEALRWHNLEPLARELHLAGGHCLPEFQPLFQAERIRQQFRDEIIQGQLHEIATAFQDRGIEFLALKGLLWAEQIYPSALYRHVGDIDLLVKPEKRDPAIDLLFELGYVVHKGLPLNFYLGQKGEVPFEYPQEGWRGQTVVELHWHPINADKPREQHLRERLRVSTEDFFRGAKPAPFRSFSLLLPRPEIWFGYQIIHGISQHKLIRLLPVVDLAYIIRSQPQFDFPCLVELMRKWHAMIPFYLGLKTLWLLGLKEGPQEDILGRLEKVMPWRIRSVMAAVTPERLLLSYAGKGRIMRKVLRLVATAPSEVAI